MDALTNNIICKFQPKMNCETSKTDADIVRNATKKIVAMGQREKLFVLNTYTLEQFKKLGE